MAKKQKKDFELNLKMDGIPICKGKHLSIDELQDIFDIAKKKNG